MAGKKCLRPGLAPLQARGHARRAECLQALLGEGVHEPRGERRLRPDNRQVDPFLTGQAGQGFDVGGGDRRGVWRAAVARRDQNVDPFAIKSPGQRVFASARANYEHLHAVENKSVDPAHP